MSTRALSESTCLQSIYKFYKAVVQVFGQNYLREPNAGDTTRLLSINASRGFPEMLGSIDCIHWEWKKFHLPGRGGARGNNSRVHSLQGVHRSLAQGCTHGENVVICEEFWF